MGSITSGVGLISGIDFTTLIDSLIALESRGKISLENRVGSLQLQQTALLDINARLLNLKGAAGSFRISNPFQSFLAKSSDEDVLTATASASATPGSYQFIVKQLVTSSQSLSKGFASADSSPLGLDALSFEFGNGQLGRELSLSELNGGNGVDRGRITISDRSGESSEIDLTDVTTVNEVIDRINSDSTIAVTASLVDDHIVLDDSSGGAGMLSVTSASGDTTAEDLGIAQTVAADTLTGSSVLYLGLDSALSALNDGNGVLVRSNVTDLTITALDGTQYDIDLGRVDLDIDDSTLLADLNNGEGVRIDSDSDEPDIKFIARDGTEFEVDLTGVTTVGELRTRVSTETGGHIDISVTDGDKLTVTDLLTPAGPQNLRVFGAGTNTRDDAAEDLGILNEVGVAAATFDGTLIPNSISDPAATSLGDVIDRINDALDTIGNPNAGHIVASISADGKRLEINDTVGGLGSLVIASTAANPDAAGQLGIETAGAGATLTGNRLVGGLDSALSSSLNGGLGFGGATTINIADRTGLNTLSIVDLDTFETVEQVIDRINTEAAAQGVLINVTLNEAGNGLHVTDTSGGTLNLKVSGDAATALGIEANVAADDVRGSNLQLQYVSNASKLSDLNYGQGVGTGAFEITDGLGNTATVNISGTEETLYDVILEINSKGLALTARVNDNGDGLIIEEDTGALGGTPPFVKIKVTSTGGSTARDLNILGEADDVSGAFIDGSYERTVDLDVTDSLDEVVSKINNAGIPVNASLINTGSGAKPYHLNLTSGIAGRAGRLVVDGGGVDLGLSTLTKGDDAKIFFGASTPEDGLLLTSQTNSFDDLLPGVDITVNSASDDPVTLTIEQDDAGIIESVRQLTVTFNDAIARMAAYDFYDSESEDRGPLLGDPTVARIRSSLYRTANSKAQNVSGSFQYLTQVGIRIGSDGQMTFDEAKFTAAYASDPQGVEELFAAYEVTATETTEEIAPGVTVTNSGSTTGAVGFGGLFDDLLDSLTNIVDGTTTLAQSSFQNRIDDLNDRIALVDSRLEAKRERLFGDFIRMEETLAQLQAQSGSLGSLSSNLSLINSQFGR